MAEDDKTPLPTAPDEEPGSEEETAELQSPQRSAALEDEEARTRRRVKRASGDVLS